MFTNVFMHFRQNMSIGCEVISKTVFTVWTAPVKSETKFEFLEEIHGLVAMSRAREKRQGRVPGRQVSLLRKVIPNERVIRATLELEASKFATARQIHGSIHLQC